jgi:hypothetical protein
MSFRSMLTATADLSATAWQRDHFLYIFAIVANASKKTARSLLNAMIETHRLRRSARFEGISEIRELGIPTQSL